MLLKNKTVVIFAAGGSLGSAIARTMARAGATIFLSNQHLEPVQALANEIIAAGGRAEAARVDALNEKDVNDYVGEIIKKVEALRVTWPRGSRALRLMRLAARQRH